jgi:hypothetical protein
MSRRSLRAISPFSLLSAICLLGCLAGGSARAEIHAAALGTDGPPPALGGYALTAFAPDPRPLYDPVLDVPSPLGGVVSFDPEALHGRVGEFWYTWSHGYQGDVYIFTGGQGTLTLPPDTGAFVFYAEPGPFQWYDITAVADDGTTLVQSVYGDSGASGYGFWTDDATPLSSIFVTLPTTSLNLAVGEFHIAAIPEPASGLLLAAGMLLWRWRRSRC